MDRFDGKPLNAPNDVAVHPDGHIWFTDPGYGILSNYEGWISDFELPTRVYRLDPDTGEAEVVTDELTRPNGLCFSPDYTRLYVVDTGCTDDPTHHRNIMVFDVADGSGCRMRERSATWRRGAATGSGWMSMAIFGPHPDSAGRIRTESRSSRRRANGSR